VASSGVGRTNDRNKKIDIRITVQGKNVNKHMAMLKYKDLVFPVAMHHKF
jgi:hypothetical protein